MWKVFVEGVPYLQTHSTLELVVNVSFFSFLDDSVLMTRQNNVTTKGLVKNENNYLPYWFVEMTSSSTNSFCIDNISSFIEVYN